MCNWEFDWGGGPGFQLILFKPIGKAPETTPSLSAPVRSSFQLILFKPIGKGGTVGVELLP